MSETRKLTVPIQKKSGAVIPLHLKSVILDEIEISNSLDEVLDFTIEVTKGRLFLKLKTMEENDD